MVDILEPTDLGLLIRWARDSATALWIIGAGSNTLVSDLGVRGVVVRLMGGPFREIREVDGLVVVGAGVSNRKFLAWCEKNGRGGMEFLEGVPGTIGGAARMNAGAWGGETGQHIAWVRFLDRAGEAGCLPANELDFGYRRCPQLADKVITEVAFRLEDRSAEHVRAARREIAEKRTWWKEVHSAGSVFRNPEGGHAGALIDRAGLKGMRIGGARIYEAHGNVIAAEAGARTSDVLALMEKARVAVRARFGVELVPEVVLMD